LSALVIDAGNTNIKLVMWNDAVAFPDFRQNLFSPGKATDVPLNLGAVSTRLVEKPEEFSSQILDLTKDVISPPVLVSVVPEVDQALKRIFPDLQVVGTGQQFPIAHEIQEPHKVGPDRWCNIAAADAAGLDSALVVDAGTATTFDLLLNKVFIGGLIAPGMAFAAQQLARQGAMLEDAPFEKRPAVVGHNTREAMTGGAWLVGCGGVEYTIDRLLETYGPLPVILTGGLAGHLSRTDRYFDPVWTLRGAASLAGVDTAF